MNNNIYICKKDIWFNRDPNYDISLRDTLHTNSMYLGFEKKYENSVLVFEKDKKYNMNSHIKGAIVYSTLTNNSYYFDFINTEYLYFCSAFLDAKKWERKLKIKKLFKNL